MKPYVFNVLFMYDLTVIFIDSVHLDVSVVGWGCNIRHGEQDFSGFATCHYSATSCSLSDTCPRDLVLLHVVVRITQIRGEPPWIV